MLPCKYPLVTLKNGTTNKQSFLQSAGIDIDNDRSDLTDEDIEIVQQMAIWYFTNGETTNYPNNLPSLYINDEQLSGLDVETNQYGQQLEYGAERQEKAEELYKYIKSRILPILLLLL